MVILELKVTVDVVPTEVHTSVAPVAVILYVGQVYVINTSPAPPVPPI